MFSLGLDNRALLTVLMSAGLLVVVILVLQLKIIFSYFDYAQKVEDMAPRVSRLAGLIESEDKLLDLSQRTRDELSLFVYPHEEEENVTGAKMQQTLRDLFSDEGMNVAGSQILTVKDARGFSRVGVSLTLTGPVDALESSLIRLESQTPTVFVDDIEIRPKRQRRRRGVDTEVQNLDVKLKLISFKLETH